MTRDVPEPLAAIIDTMKDDGYSYREMALALAYQIAGHEMFDESAWNASARPALTVTEKGMSELILDIEMCIRDRASSDSVLYCCSSKRI